VGIQCGNSEIKEEFKKSSGNQHSCKRNFCSAFAALLAVRLLVLLVFVACAFCSLLEKLVWKSPNQRGIQNEINRNQRGN
jgi:hypothetical protein